MPRVAITRTDARARLGIAGDTLVLGLFGTAHSSRLLPLIRAAVQAAYDENPNVLVLYTGPHAPAICEALQGLPVRAEGPFESDEVSRRFAAMDIYLASYIDGVSTRRGAFMAALQHGITTVGTSGPLTDDLLLQEDGKAFLLADVNSFSAFADAALRLVKEKPLQQRLGQQGEALYKREFAWPKVARKLDKTLSKWENNERT